MAQTLELSFHNTNYGFTNRDRRLYMPGRLLHDRDRQFKKRVFKVVEPGQLPANSTLKFMVTYAISDRVYALANLPDPTPDPICVVKFARGDQDLTKLEKEIAAYRELARVQGKVIPAFYGRFATDDGKLHCILLEYCGRQVNGWHAHDLKEMEDKCVQAIVNLHRQAGFKHGSFEPRKILCLNGRLTIVNLRAAEECKKCSHPGVQVRTNFTLTSPSEDKPVHGAPICDELLYVCSRMGRYKALPIEIKVSGQTGQESVITIKDTLVKSKEARPLVEQIEKHNAYNVGFRTKHLTRFFCRAYFAFYKQDVPLEDLKEDLTKEPATIQWNQETYLGNFPEQEVVDELVKTPGIAHKDPYSVLARMETMKRKMDKDGEDAARKWWNGLTWDPK